MLIELNSYRNGVQVFHKVGDDEQHCNSCYINTNQIISINCYIHEHQQKYVIFMSNASSYIIKIIKEDNEDYYINNIIRIRKLFGIVYTDSTYCTI